MYCSSYIFDTLILSTDDANFNCLPMLHCKYSSVFLKDCKSPIDTPSLLLFDLDIVDHIMGAEALCLH